MKTISIIKKKLVLAASCQALAAGKLIVYPTETCYGLGADATNPKAVDRLLQFKGDRGKKPISVAVCCLKMAEKYAHINPTARNIFRCLLPGPVTVVCEGKHYVDPRLESSTGTLGIRFPDYPLVLEIIAAFGKPIAATSANISGGKTPYSKKDILGQLPPQKCDLISLFVDAGKLPANPPSTVVDTTMDNPEILRQGRINIDLLKATSIITHSPQETSALAEILLEKYLCQSGRKTIIFALQGELGSGKTQFAKGLGRKLGIGRVVKSPTFNIAHEYPFQKRTRNGIFYHLDAWRLESGRELAAIGFGQMIKPGNIIALEWPEKGKNILEGYLDKPDVLLVVINFEHLSATERRIRFVNH